MSKQIMIYGANGYTGELIAREAVEQGIKPVLSGRNAKAVQALAAELGLSARPASLENEAEMIAALDGIGVMLNAAGPFAETWAHASRFCLQTGTHYLDITGEPDVLAGCSELHQAAVAAGIVLLPAVGFDVVPTDCVAAMLKERLPDASSLLLAFGGMEQGSRGTVRTMLNHIDKPVFVRHNGKIKPRKGPNRTQVDFGSGPVTVFATTWGDIVTAWHSTSIPSIEVFVDATPELRKILNMGPIMRRVLASPIGKPLINWQLRSMPPGPNAEMRATVRARVFGRATNPAGEAVEIKLETPEGYRLTAMTAVGAAVAVCKGKVASGFHTPSDALGSDFVLGFDGVVLKH